MLTIHSKGSKIHKQCKQNHKKNAEKIILRLQVRGDLATGGWGVAPPLPVEVLSPTGRVVACCSEKALKNRRPSGGERFLEDILGIFLVNYVPEFEGQKKIYPRIHSERTVYLPSQKCIKSLRHIIGDPLRVRGLCLYPLSDFE